jgi:hypothetical protein
MSGTWHPVSVEPPTTPRETRWGGERWSGWLLVLFPHTEHADTPPDYPLVNVACLIDYGDGYKDWFTPCDASGGLDRCNSHGYPAPIAWCELPKEIGQALAEVKP